MNFLNKLKTVTFTINKSWKMLANLISDEIAFLVNLNSRLLFKSISNDNESIEDSPLRN